MSKHERLARIEGIDVATGSFGMTLASESEASDGDILSIAGGKVPAKMPMLTSHFNDPTKQLGSITNPEKALEEKPPRLRATGQIEMSGDGPEADIRRDVAHMIDKGHVQSVSIRWDTVTGGKQPIRRINLASDHPYFVDSETEKDYRKRWGYFWPEWRALEGSVVALGADPVALIGRSRDTEGELSTFWRAMAEDAEADASPAKISASLAALRIDAADAREAGASNGDLINAVIDRTDEDFEPIKMGDRIFFVPASIAGELVAGTNEREAVTDLQPEPDKNPAERETDKNPAREALDDQPSRLTLDVAELLTPANVDALARLLSEGLDDYDERIKRMVQGILDQRTGKV